MMSALPLHCNHDDVKQLALTRVVLLQTALLVYLQP